MRGKWVVGVKGPWGWASGSWAWCCSLLGEFVVIDGRESSEPAIRRFCPMRAGLPLSALGSLLMRASIRNASVWILADWRGGFPEKNWPVGVGEAEGRLEGV